MERCSCIYSYGRIKLLYSLLYYIRPTRGYLTGWVGRTPWLFCSWGNVLQDRLCCRCSKGASPLYCFLSFLASSSAWGKARAMVTTRKRAAAAEVPASPKKRSGTEARRRRLPLPVPPPPAAEGGSGYEKFREERIKENLERMQKLGILQLKSQVDPIVHSDPSKRPYHQRKVAQFSSSLVKTLAPARRSSRYINTVPFVAYSLPIPTTLNMYVSPLPD